MQIEELAVLRPKQGTTAGAACCAMHSSPKNEAYHEHQTRSSGLVPAWAALLDMQQG
jgi:hypothetical protein